MPETKVYIAARTVSAEVSVLDIQGDISAAAENALMDAYTQACCKTTRVIILNFTSLDYMNSSGIGLIVTLLMRANSHHQRLLCYGLSDHYQHIFTLTRLSDVIKMYATEEEALAAV